MSHALSFPGAAARCRCALQSLLLAGVACVFAIATSASAQEELPTEIHFAQLSTPATISVQEGVNPGEVRGQLYIAGETEDALVATGVFAELGVGPAGTDPTTWTNWAPATLTEDQTTNLWMDEYRATLTALPAGAYSYVFRFNRNGGPLFYADLDGDANGLQVEQFGSLTVLAGTLTPTPSPTESLTPTVSATPSPTETESPTPSPSESPTPTDIPRDRKSVV